MKNSIKSWLALSVCFFVLICSIIVFIQGNKDPSISRHQAVFTDVGFDTSITFQANCSSSDFDHYTSILKDTYIHYDHLFDQYDSYDEIHNVYTLNHFAYSNWIKVDPELTELIRFSMAINEKAPQFDISQGNLLSLWHDHREQGMIENEKGKSGSLPSDNSIEEAMKHSGNDKIQIKENEIHFTDPDLKIDLGAIAKGYATQKVKEKLEENGCKEGFINAGGNVVLIGNKDTWNIGIQDPDSSDSLLSLKTTNPIAIVTSGDYQRYYTVDKKRYSHIIDPTTGYPPEYHRSVTIFCEDSTLADGLSTALFCMSLEQGKSFLEQNYPDVGAVWIDEKKVSSKTPDIQTKNYDIYVTDNYKDKISLH